MAGDQESNQKPQDKETTETSQPVDTTPKEGDIPNGKLESKAGQIKEEAAAEPAQENTDAQQSSEDTTTTEEEGDISDVGLLKQPTQKKPYFRLLKHGYTATCPNKPERSSYNYSKDGKIESTSIITPECTSYCPLFQIAKEDGKYLVSIKCGCEPVEHEIPESEVIIGEPPKAAKPKGEGLIRNIKQ